MISARPEQGIDFTFTHNNINYAIGYQSDSEAYALSKQSADVWSWILAESGVDNTLESADEFLNMFLGKVNKEVFSGSEPQEPTNEFEKLLQVTANGLQYTPTGIIRK